MQVLLEVNDKQSDFAMSVFRSLEFVKKGETVSDSKAAFIKDLKLAMKEVALAKRGKIKLKSAEQLINEL